MNFTPIWVNLSNHFKLILFYVFYVEKLVYRNPKFRIPVIFADDLSGSDKSNAKLLRNVARCLAIPCMFSTKNTVILNTMDTEKTINWMILVIRSSKVDVKSICKNLKVVDDLTLDNYLTSDLQLFLQTESGSEFKLLRDLGITSNEDERAKLVGLWKLLLDQSETGLQGVVSLAFSQFVDSLKSIRVGQLDVKNIWISVCYHVSKYILELRMFTFSNDSQYYGLRMFSSHRFIRGSFWDIENKLIKGSIEDHFYYFGSPTDPAILKLDHSNGELVQNNERYKVACNFSPFDQNIILNMVVWKHALLNKSAASFFPNYVNKVCGDFPIYDLKPILHQSKQTITLWAIANCTHQNFVGDSGGKDVVSELIGHLQSSKSIERKFCPFPLDEFTESLGLFLGRIKFPYLLPETFPGLQEKLGDFCRVGKIIQLPEEGRIDVEFELLFDGSSAVGLAMCKYTIEPKTQQDINQSTEIAENRKSPLSFYLCHHLDLQLKCPGALNLEISQTSDVPPFRLNIYSVYHVDEDLKMVPLREYENPDGVFLLIESNMKYGKNL